MLLEQDEVNPIKIDNYGRTALLHVTMSEHVHLVKKYYSEAMTSTRQTR